MGMDKEASKLSTGTFYLVGDTIAYTLDTSDEDAIDHYQLWDFVVDKLFPHIDFDTKQDLKRDAVYGSDRGRIVFKGERSPTGAFRSGSFSLYGTPGCKRFESRLKAIFGLNALPKQYELEVDFKSDPHYKVQPSDKRVLDSVLKVTEQPAQEVRVAGWKKTPKTPDIKLDK